MCNKAVFRDANSALLIEKSIKPIKPIKNQLETTGGVTMYTEDKDKLKSYLVVKNTPLETAGQLFAQSDLLMSLALVKQN